MIPGMQDQAAKLMDEVLTLFQSVYRIEKRNLGKSQLHTIAHKKGDPLL